jgi:hypothetical protein
MIKRPCLPNSENALRLCRYMLLFCPILTHPSLFSHPPASPPHRAS